MIGSGFLRIYRITIFSTMNIIIKEMITLNVDGRFGKATAKRLQEYFDTAGKDGVISHQYKQTFSLYYFLCKIKPQN
ncbi:hypothetical protein LLUC11_02580 [Lactococcus lactis subsp. lactis]|nr:hypothetical protein [Lactococcus lactis]WJQ33684.1 hypothetical protein LLUC08_02595 [Lactococcus lactis subsp. lactis]WKK96110.1 hypothetical protein LLUC11_02580 [Lactococcus lactis subsp. lactis]